MKNLSKKIKELFIKSKKEYSGQINPHKHWMFLLVSFFLTGGVLIVFSLYILYKIKNEQIFQSSSSVENKPSQLKEDLIKQVTDTFEKKAQKTEEIKKTPPVFKDPSI